MDNETIPFNRPFMTGKELEYVAQAHANAHLAGDGVFTKKCHAWLETYTGASKALLVHSCTAALEIAAILADIQPGDEIIMPSYTFVSTANAFVLRGGIPVFVDIRADTLNIDETKIEAAITSKTKAIVPVHYAGVGCEMDAIMDIARRHNLLVIEDAAQGMMSTYRGRALGAIGDMGCLSFHETKNIISGEGGGLLINNPKYVERAEIIREKGTNRSQFFRNEVDKYTWVDIGSSYLPSELIAAFLWAQFEGAEMLTKRRLDLWHQYQSSVGHLQKRELLRCPFVPSECTQNAHMYYVVLSNSNLRTKVLEQLKQQRVNAIFHYVPLHSSPAGMKLGRTHGTLSVTETISSSIVRLPIWIGMTDRQIEKVVDSLEFSLRQFG